MKKYIERYWRKATKEDSVRDPMMVARFRDGHGYSWKIGSLRNWFRDCNFPWVDQDGVSWHEAEVYDAPDPGEGYELVDPCTEKPGPGIEFLFGIHWHRAGETAPLDVNATYRRKIVSNATVESVAAPVNCQQDVNVQVNVDGKKVLVRPLLPSDEINSGDIWIEDGVWERAYTAVGLLQSNADHQHYREVRPQPKSEPEAAATKPEAAEPVTFVAHPIQINEELEYCFQGKPIQFGSYAVLNEQGHYLQHLPAYPPQYAPEFRQAFTPLQLLQLSVRELGSNVRLRAVEPVDVDKLKQEYMQELKEKLRPKVPVWEPKRQKVMWQGREYWVLTRFHTVTDHGHSPNVRVVLQDANALESYVAMAFADDLQEIPSEPQPEAPQPVKEPKYVPFTWDDQDDFGGEWIENKACKKIELIAKFNEINGHLLINDKLASDILEDWRFVRNGEPVGKRVED